MLKARARLEPYKVPKSIHTLPELPGAAPPESCFETGSAVDLTKVSRP